tara:strand:- start:32 stop:535 length:504 start_codon:yes stop_codon:yes gene_type:complete
MNPFLIVRHGARPMLAHELNNVGRQEAKELGDRIKELLPDTHSQTYLCFGDTPYGGFYANSETAEIVGEILGVNAVREPIFVADPYHRPIPDERKEQMAAHFEEKQIQGPFLCVTSDSIISAIAPYVDKKYNFDVGLEIEFVQFASGFLFDFEKNDVLYLPPGYSIK